MNNNALQNLRSPGTALGAKPPADGTGSACVVKRVVRTYGGFSEPKISPLSSVR
jgi:hypothetical protein